MIIKDRWGKKLFEVKEADLREANLREANLQEADLREANLWGANLWEANLQEADLWGANLREANLREANLWRANLREADLQEANLREANLQEADLREANLQEADLREADLRGANLREAKLYLPFSVEVGNIYYKSVELRKGKIYSPTLTREYQWFVGKEHKTECNTDPRLLCAEGLHLFTKAEAMRWEGSHLLKVRVLPGDICVPYASDGKFRVERVKVLELIDKKDAK